MKTKVFKVTYGNGGVERCRGVVALGRFLEHLATVRGASFVFVEIQKREGK